MSQGEAVYEIRKALQDDAEAITRVHIESFMNTYTNYPKTLSAAMRGGRSWEASWADRLRGASGRILVATSGTEIVGFIDIAVPSDDGDHRDRVGQIRSIHVAPARTRSGIGNLLMAAGEDLLEELGVGEATLWVVTDNHRAQSFYERIGWVRDEERRMEKLAVADEDGDQVEVVRYRKILASREASR